MNVLYGSAAGVTGTGSQVFTQVGGAVETGDVFERYVDSSGRSECGAGSEPVGGSFRSLW